MVAAPILRLPTPPRPGSRAKGHTNIARSENNPITEVEPSTQPTLSPEGRTNNVKTAKGTKVETGFKLMDPVAKFIEAANISAVLKKVIAYLNANPGSHEISCISKKFMDAITESIKTARRSMAIDKAEGDPATMWTLTGCWLT